MASKNGEICDFCRKGRLSWQTKEMPFRQWSDKGTVQCSAALSVGTCDTCGAKTLEPGSEQIFEAAFRRAYDKLPRGGS